MCPRGKTAFCASPDYQREVNSLRERSRAAVSLIFPFLLTKTGGSVYICDGLRLMCCPSPPLIHQNLFTVRSPLIGSRTPTAPTTHPHDPLRSQLLGVTRHLGGDTT